MAVKKYSEKTAVSVIGSMLKYNRKNDPREVLGYSWIDGSGRQCAVNGYMAFRLAVPVAGLPDVPAGWTTIDLDRLFPASLEKHTRLETPDAAEVAALIAYDRRTGSAGNPCHNMYMFGDGLPVVNTAYLRDMLRVFPDAEYYFSNNVSPIYVKSEHGDGVILPIRVDDEKKRARRVLPDEKPADNRPAWSLAAFAAKFAA